MSGQEGVPRSSGSVWVSLGLRTMSVKGWQCHEWKRCRCPDVGEVYLLQSEWFSCDGRSTRPGLACLMKDKLCRET